MATYFIDLDGCIFFHGTNDVIPGAYELLEKIIKSGNEIIFTTLRGDKNFHGHKIYSREGAMLGIRALRIPYKEVIFDIDSPRIVINDSGAYSINHAKNEKWEQKEIDGSFFE